VDGGLEEQPFVEHEDPLDTREGVGIDGIHHRVGVQIILGRELGLDVDWRDVPADAEDHPLGDVREINVQIELKRVITVQVIVLEQLVAEPALGRGVSIVDAVQVRHLEAPVHVIGLVRIGLPLEDEDCLGQLQLVRHDIVDHRDVRIAGRAEGDRRIGPAVDLQPAVLPELAGGSVLQGLGQGPDRLVPDPDQGPEVLAEGKRGRLIRRRRQPARLGSFALAGGLLDEERLVQPLEE
jgi:hypothetical protein